MNILTFIEELRNSDRYIKHIYTEGGCYKFHLLLSKMYKNCAPYISWNKNHIITRYKGKYYDINGERGCIGYTELNSEEIPIVSKWSFHKNNLIVIEECPHCEEPLIYNDSKRTN